jgi:phage baseplate assembly protein W
MNGTDENTGKALGGIAHLRQSIRRLITTPIGSRVMRRDYGSRLFQLIDAPLNASTRMDIIAATADAIKKWEPRFQLLKVDMTGDQTGLASISLTGKYLPDGQAVRLNNISVK